MGNPAFIGIGVVAIILGVTMFLKREWWWQLTQWDNESRGVASERSDLYEVRIVGGGVFAIVLGLACIWIGFAK
jgi:hypothetical protein